ncbi:MAG: Ig-like domain-containing protein [Bacteroidota bacterium]|nr:Ig-like domain-containing protein [Bacteroidota bacterium]
MLTKPDIKIGYFLLGCCLLFLLFSCAKQGSPSGGPKDTESPEVTYAEPQSGTVNFDENHFDISFDEYIQLNNIQQNLIVSPPFSEKPEVKIRGKSIRVVLPEKPQSNTTYSFTFLDAISDITERNTIINMVYAFSTGPKIDSLRVSGVVTDAFTEKPVADVFVMLHRNPADSMFKKHVPDYLTKTNEQGKFKFFYVSPGTYKIYALDDANYSSTFDQPNEKIAFLDSLIVPGVEPVKDSTDSITGYHYYPDSLKLRLFEQAQYLQFAETTERPQSNKMQVFFKHPQDSAINWYSPDFDSTQVVTEFSEHNDSLVFWLTDTSLCRQDSLQLIVDYYSNIDSVGWKTDSLMMTSKSDFDEEKLDVDVNLAKSQLNYWEMPQITVNSVIKQLNPDSLHLFHRVNDSVKKAVDFDIEHSDNRSFWIKAKFRQEKEYVLMLDTTAIEDVLYRFNDSTVFEFTVNKEDDFSTLQVTIPGTDTGWYCDLLKNDKIIRHKVISDEGTFIMFHLEPGTYRLRLVKDVNHNQKWDTGDFDKKRQPEPVWYKSEEIKLRANWTQEIEWMLFEENTENPEDEK